MITSCDGSFDLYLTDLGTVCSAINLDCIQPVHELCRVLCSVYYRPWIRLLRDQALDASALKTSYSTRRTTDTITTSEIKMEIKLPRIDIAQYDEGHGRVAMQDWLSRLTLMLNCYEVHSFTSEWALEIDPGLRHNHGSYPLRPPLTDKKRTAHRVTQATLLQAIQQGLADMPRITTIMGDFPLARYGRADLAVGAEPYPVATMLLKRVIEEYAPADIDSVIEESDRLDEYLRTMPRFTCSDPKSFMTFLDTLYSKYLCQTGAADAAQERTLMARIKKALEMHDMSDNVAAPIIKFEPILMSWKTHPPATMRDLYNQLAKHCQDKTKLCKRMAAKSAALTYQPLVFKQPAPASAPLAAQAIPDDEPRPTDFKDPCAVCNKTTHHTKQCRKFQQMT